MNIDQNAFNQIAVSLSKHFVSLYYVEIETGNYIEFNSPSIFLKETAQKEGTDFFSMADRIARKIVHPDDLERVLKFHDRETVLKKLSEKGLCSIMGRMLIDGTIIHARQIYIMCDDNKHILCCLENIESEFQEKAEQKKNLQSAERMARRDELTGIKNKNAFTEYSRSLDEAVKSGKKEKCFAVVMCDLNNLKLINDTRGHSYGDEILQQTSLMICNVFKHSPVFRIGGDEFAAVLVGSDYDNRELLLKILREESDANGRSRSGPEVACGMAEFDPEKDTGFSEVFERSDRDMYANKHTGKIRKEIENNRKSDKKIPPERKRRLDGLFGALFTVAGEGYVYLNDMLYDYSRWSMSLTDDFGLESEYMYHADKIWQTSIHPDDLKVYEEAVDAVLCGNGELQPITYRARKADGTYVMLATRGFVLSDKEGNPEYFGGIIIPK